MPKTQEKIKVLRGTRANIAAVAASGKASDFNLEQGELALDVTDGYLIAGKDSSKLNNGINKTDNIVKTNELVGYKNDADGTIAPENTYDKLPADATFDADQTYYQFNISTNEYEVVTVTSETFNDMKDSLYTFTNNRGGEYSVRFTNADNKLTIKNENGDIDTTAHSSVNVTAQGGDINEIAQNGNINETASGEVNVTAQGGDVDIDASQNVTIDANGGNVSLKSTSVYTKLPDDAEFDASGNTKYYTRSGTDPNYTYTIDNTVTADNFDYKKVNLYTKDDGEVIFNTNTKVSDDGNTFTVGSVKIDGNTNSSLDVKKITNGNNAVDINKITNLGKVEGEVDSNKRKTVLNSSGSGSSLVKGIELETNTATSGTGAKQSTVRTDNLETDTIKSRAETDLDIQSKGTGKVIKLNTKTTISKDGQTLKVENGQNNTQVTPEDIKVDLIQPSTTDVRTKIDKNYLNNTTSIVGSNGVWVKQEVPIGSYLRGTEYSVNDWIKNDNKYYCCKTAYTAATEIFDPTNWDDKTFDISKIYVNNDLVGNNDKIYKYTITLDTRFIKINSDKPSNKDAKKDGIKMYTAADGESTIYSDNFVGDLQGNVTGDVSGNATSATRATSADVTETTGVGDATVAFKIGDGTGYSKTVNNVQHSSSSDTATDATWATKIGSSSSATSEGNSTTPVYLDGGEFKSCQGLPRVFQKTYGNPRVWVKELKSSSTKSSYYIFAAGVFYPQDSTKGLLNVQLSLTPKSFGTDYVFNVPVGLIAYDMIKGMFYETIADNSYYTAAFGQSAQPFKAGTLACAPWGGGYGGSNDYGSITKRIKIGSSYSYLLKVDSNDSYSSSSEDEYAKGTDFKQSVVDEDHPYKGYRIPLEVFIEDDKDLEPSCLDYSFSMYIYNITQ